MMLAIPSDPVDVDELTLVAAERAIADAIDRRDASDLTVLGFGEIAVAIGWPTESLPWCSNAPSSTGTVPTANAR